MHDASEIRAAAKADSQPSFLPTEVASDRQRRLALGAVIVSAAIFLAAAPFSQAPLAPVPAFLPAYQAALIVLELVTAVLLYGQFAILGGRGLLVLASAYLFNALMAVAHALSFPGLFAPGGLMAAGPQTTAWLYFLWHMGFPLAVIAFARLPAAEPAARGSRAAAIALGALAAALAAAACVLATTAGHDALPVIMSGNRDAPAKLAVAAFTWLLCLAAVPLLWRRYPRTVLDLWLIVVMCAWMFDVALAAVLNAGRFDLGWYAGRAYGLLAGSFVLLVLLLENSLLYARLARSHARHDRRLALLHAIDRALAAEQPPEAIASAIVPRLREVLDADRATICFFDAGAAQVRWLATAGRHHVLVESDPRLELASMGDASALVRGEAQRVDTRAMAAGRVRDGLLASGVQHSIVEPMIAGGRLLGVLAIGSARPQADEEQRAIGREVAMQLAIAAVHAGLFERGRNAPSVA